jgi:GTP cyclohydrolase II
MQKTIFLFALLSIVPLWGPEKEWNVDILKEEAEQAQATAIALHKQIHRIIDNCKDKDFLASLSCDFDWLDEAMAAVKNEKTKGETIRDPIRLHRSKVHFKDLIQGMELVLKRARENSKSEVE